MEFEIRRAAREAVAVASYPVVGSIPQDAQAGKHVQGTEQRQPCRQQLIQGLRDRTGARAPLTRRRDRPGRCFSLSRCQTNSG